MMKKKNHMKFTALHHRNSKTRWSNDKTIDRMRRLERVVTLAENELLKLKDNLKLTQEILPRESTSTSKSDNLEMVKKCSTLDGYERNAGYSPNTSFIATSSEEFLKTISERTERTERTEHTEVDLASEPLVFNVKIVPSVNCNANAIAPWARFEDRAGSCNPDHSSTAQSDHRSKCNPNPCIRFDKMACRKRAPNCAILCDDDLSKCKDAVTCRDDMKISKLQAQITREYDTSLNSSRVIKPIKFVPPKRKPFVRPQKPVRTPEKSNRITTPEDSVEHPRPYVRPQRPIRSPYKKNDVIEERIEKTMGRSPAKPMKNVVEEYTEKVTRIPAKPAKNAVIEEHIEKMMSRSPAKPPKNVIEDQTEKVTSRIPAKSAKNAVIEEQTEKISSRIPAKLTKNLVEENTEKAMRRASEKPSSTTIPEKRSSENLWMPVTTDTKVRRTHKSPTKQSQEPMSTYHRRIAKKLSIKTHTSVGTVDSNTGLDSVAVTKERQLALKEGFAPPPSVKFKYTKPRPPEPVHVKNEPDFAKLRVSAAKPPKTERPIATILQPHEVNVGEAKKSAAKPTGMLQLAQNAMKNIDSLTITDSCNHLQFKYVDPHSLRKLTKIEVYIANHPDNRPMHSGEKERRVPRKAPCQCGVQKKKIPLNCNRKQLCCDNRCCREVKTRTFCPNNTDWLRKQSILDKCRIQTIPCVNIDKSLEPSMMPCSKVVSGHNSVMSKRTANTSTLKPYNATMATTSMSAHNSGICCTPITCVSTVLVKETFKDTQPNNNKLEGAICDDICEAPCAIPHRTCCQVKCGMPCRNPQEDSPKNLNDDIDVNKGLPCLCANFTPPSAKAPGTARVASAKPAPAKPVPANSPKEPAMVTRLVTDIPSKNSRSSEDKNKVTTLYNYHDLVSSTDVTSISCICFPEGSEEPDDEKSEIAEKPTRKCQSCCCLKGAPRPSEGKPVKMPQKKVSINERVTECIPRQTCNSCDKDRSIMRPTRNGNSDKNINIKNGDKSSLKKTSEASENSPRQKHLCQLYNDSPPKCILCNQELSKEERNAGYIEPPPRSQPKNTREDNPPPPKGCCARKKSNEALKCPAKCPICNKIFLDEVHSKELCTDSSCKPQKTCVDCPPPPKVGCCARRQSAGVEKCPSKCPVCNQKLAQNDKLKSTEQNSGANICTPKKTCDECQPPPGCCTRKKSSDKIKTEQLCTSCAHGEAAKAQEVSKGSSDVKTSTLASCQCQTSCNDLSCSNAEAQRRRNAETPEQKGCCACCRRKKKLCENSRCTELCRTSAMVTTNISPCMVDGSPCANHELTIRRTSSNRSSSTPPNDRPQRPMRNREVVKVAHCAITDTLHSSINYASSPLAGIEDISPPISLERYIMVHDVSAQAEMVEQCSASITTLKDDESLKKNHSLDDLLSLGGYSSPDSKHPRSRSPQKVFVNPFNDEFLRCQSRPTLETACSPLQLSDLMPSTSTKKYLKSQSTPHPHVKSSEKKEALETIDKYERNGLCNKRQEHLSKSKLFHWKSMRRRKVPLAGKEKDHAMDTSSEGELDCKCTVSIGEIHNCTRDSAGQSNEDTFKKQEVKMAVAHRHRSRFNKNVVSYYISTSSIEAGSNKN